MAVTTDKTSSSVHSLLLLDDPPSPENHFGPVKTYGVNKKDRDVMKSEMDTFETERQRQKWKHAPGRAKLLLVHRGTNGSFLRIVLRQILTATVLICHGPYRIYSYVLGSTK